MRKLLFLDCDGVINNRGSFLKDRSNSFPTDQNCVKLINQIRDATGCDIVLSSSWRLYKEWKELLTPLLGEILYTTPSSLGYRSRGEEIDQWLFDNTSSTNVKFCILDDSPDMLDYQLPYFIRTEFDSGITPQQAARAIRILNGNNS